MVPSDKTECTDKVALKDGYWIGRHPEFVSNPLYFKRFIAKHNWTDENEIPIATLAAEIGECNDLNTVKDSQKCGIGSELLKFCLEDPGMKIFYILLVSRNCMIFLHKYKIHVENKLQMQKGFFILTITCI